MKSTQETAFRDYNSKSMWLVQYFDEFENPPKIHLKFTLNSLNICIFKKKNKTKFTRILIVYVEKRPARRSSLSSLSAKFWLVMSIYACMCVAKCSQISKEMKFFCENVAASRVLWIYRYFQQQSLCRRTLFFLRSPRLLNARGS